MQVIYHFFKLFFFFNFTHFHFVKIYCSQFLHLLSLIYFYLSPFSFFYEAVLDSWDTIYRVCVCVKERLVVQVETMATIHATAIFWWVGDFQCVSWESSVWRCVCVTFVTCCLSSVCQMCEAGPVRALRWTFPIRWCDWAVCKSLRPPGQHRYVRARRPGESVCYLTVTSSLNYSASSLTISYSLEL